VPDERSQLDWEKLPCPELDQLMAPDGAEPFTVAVHVAGVPTTTGDGAQLATVGATVSTLPRLAEGITPPGGEFLTLAHCTEIGEPCPMTKPAASGYPGHPPLIGCTEVPSP
jgi:hypothetical protein